MTIDATRFQKLLDALKLEPLFNEPGWDNASLKPQAERLKLLNQTAIHQMKLLLADAGARRLEGKQP